MPDRIQSYQQRVAVNDGGRFRATVDQVADPGQEITRVGQTLLREAEPFVAQRAEREAIAAAGVADIVKDEGGNFVRPDAPKGGGLRYAAVYDRAMDDRYVELVSKDYEHQADVAAAEFRNDPSGFEAKMSGMGEGFLNGVDARVRARVETNITREFSERFRGLSAQKSANDWQANVNGLNDTMSSRLKAAVSIFQTGGDGARERAEVEIAAARSAADQLVALREFTPAGADARMASALIDIGEAQQVHQSFEQLEGFVGHLAGMSDTDLAEISLWGQGGPSHKGATVDGMTFDQFQELMPSRSVRGQASSIASQALSRRITAANQAAADARAASLQNTVEKVVSAVKDANYMPPQGWSKPEAAALDADFMQRIGPAHVAMAKPEGRTQVLGFLGENGFLPTGVKEYVEGQVLGNNVHAVTDFVQNMKEVSAKGMWVGQRLYEGLSPETRATIEFDEALARSGVPAQSRQSYLEAARRKDLPSVEQVVQSFRMDGPDGKGISYSTAKAQTIAKQFGISEAQARASMVLGGDFDQLMRHNTQLYRGNVGQAMLQTVRSISNGWKANPNFVGGIGPRDLATSGLSVGQLDRALTQGAPGNQTGASFAAGTAKLRPVADRSGAGFGTYVVEFYTRDGRPAGSAYADMDKALAPELKKLADYRSRQAAAKVSGASGGSRWQLRKGADGKVRYQLVQ